MLETIYFVGMAIYPFMIATLVAREFCGDFLDFCMGFFIGLMTSFLWPVIALAFAAFKFVKSIRIL